LLGAGVSMYVLAREWAPPGSAVLAACLYIANPYAMFVVYERSALGELLAGAWFPLIVLFALRTRSSIAPLGLTVAALWLTNSPAAVMSSYLLAVLASGLWIVEGRPWPALRALGGIALGLGLAAFYIVPAAFEQRWVQIERAINPGMRVEDSFLFAHTRNAFHDQVLWTASWIFVAEALEASIAAYLAWKERGGGRVRVVLTALLPIMLLLQLPASYLIWQHTPHLKFLQFPWRWTLALSVATCLLAAMALRKPSRRMAMAMAVLIVAMAIGGGVLFFQPCDDEDAVAAQVSGFREGQGTQGTDEYAPKGADNSAVQQHLPLVRALSAANNDTADSSKGDNPEWRTGASGSVAATVNVRQWNAEHWTVSVVSAEAGYAVLRLMDYPSWRVTVDDKAALERPLRDDGLMAIPITAGRHVMDVQWAATRDVIAGRTISAIALLALGIVVMLERRERRV
jgi:hypothetical protein